MADNPVADEMRLYALELLVASLFAALHDQSRDPLATILALRQKLIEKTRSRPFPGLDPATSDLASGELEEAFERLLKMQAEFLGVALPKEI